MPDSEAVPVIFDLVEHEGLVLGGSSGVNIAGAIRLAREMGPGHTIVTILADYGTRYQSKLFNPEFLTAHGSADAGVAGGEEPDQRAVCGGHFCRRHLISPPSPRPATHLFTFRVWW